MSAELPGSSKTGSASPSLQCRQPCRRSGRALTQKRAGNFILLFRQRVQGLGKSLETEGDNNFLLRAILEMNFSLCVGGPKFTDNVGLDVRIGEAAAWQAARERGGQSRILVVSLKPHAGKQPHIGWYLDRKLERLAFERANSHARGRIGL